MPACVVDHAVRVKFRPASLSADTDRVERFDVFVIGGGGTGSEIAFQLGRERGMRVGIAERDKLGGECNYYGCVPTKVILRSAFASSP